MRRVVVTGMGAVSSIGFALDSVSDALRSGQSGLASAPDLQDWGLRCGVFGDIKGFDGRHKIPKRMCQTMSNVATYAASAAVDAMDLAQLQTDAVDVRRAGVIIGTEFGGVNEISRMHWLLETGKKSRAGATGVVKSMNSSAAANVAAMLGWQGRTYSLSSSFATGLDNIADACTQVRRGVLDVALCGSTEEECWKQIGPYLDNLNILSTGFNDRPEQSCRPYDLHRQGIVLSAGAGVLLIESLEHARRRGARVYAEVVGYGRANDGNDMCRPSGEGLARTLDAALSQARASGLEHLDYVNTHGTGTPIGDRVEIDVLRRVVGQQVWVSSTKGQTGHALGAGGSLEAVFTLLMMRDGFIAPTQNLARVDPLCEGVRHARRRIDQPVEAALTFSVGLGGANSAMVFRNLTDA